MDTLGQLALVLAIFVGVVAIAFRRGREDPVERLWIPIAVGLLPFPIAWILAQSNGPGQELALAWILILGVIGGIGSILRESRRAGEHMAEFREAVAISVFAALFSLSWFLWAGYQASWLAVPMFIMIYGIGWARYQAAKRGTWW